MKKVLLLSTLVAVVMGAVFAYDHNVIEPYIEENETGEQYEVTTSDTEIPVEKYIEEKVQDGTGLCGTVIYSPGASGFVESPLQTTVVVTNEAGIEVARGDTDAVGFVALAVAPGTYTIEETDYGQKRPVRVSGIGCTQFSLIVAAP